MRDHSLGSACMRKMAQTMLHLMITDRHRGMALTLQDSSVRPGFQVRECISTCWRVILVQRVCMQDP